MTPSLSHDRIDSPQPEPAAGAVWRIDHLVVPETAREALLDRLRLTHTELGRLAGCLVNRIVEAPAVDGRRDLLTLVAWRDAAAMADARRHMQRHHAETGFDAAAFLGRHGITMQMGTYHDVIPAPEFAPAP